MIDSLEAVAVGVMYHHVAIDISLLELAFKDVAVLLGQLSPTVLQVVLPAANIDVAILPYESTLSGTLTIHKLSGVFRTAGRAENSFTGTLTLRIITFIDITVMEFVDTLTVLDIILPVTNIGITVSIFKGTLA